MEYDANGNENYFVKIVMDYCFLLTEGGLLSVSGKHERFDRMVWVFKSDFTGALAKWLVKQSPYAVPDNLEKILVEFHERIPYDFDQAGMAEVSLMNMTEGITMSLSLCL